MILQCLHDYYERMRSDPRSDIPQPGYAPQQISFAIVLERDGTLVQVQDVRDTSEKNPRAVSMMIPEATIRAVNPRC